MKVLVAKTAGFCWGVRRAMDAVLEASARSEGRKIQTLGPLIHNPQALELIGKRGVEVAESPAAVADGTVVIRAHGIPIQDLRGLKARQARGELNLVNATCPEVAKVHSKIKKWSPKGYFTVILGIHGHAESTAHQSFADCGSIIVANMTEAEALTDEQLRKVLLVAQTTFTVKDFEVIADYLRSRAGDLIVENTICEDTWRRQAEAREIAAKVDAVVIVGGKNSANTRHLAELAQQYGKPCQFVETAAELDLETFHGIASVGVLAGASTPTWLVEEVVAALEQLGHGRRRFMRLFRNGFGVPLRLAIGAALMAMGIHAWMGIPETWHYPLITAAYVLAMYMLAPYADPLGVGARGPARAKVLERHRRLLVGTGVGSLLMALVLAAWQGIGSLIVVVSASAFGLAYKRHVKIGRLDLSLVAIPGSKDVLVSLALAIVAVALPLWHHSWAWGIGTWAGIFFVTALVFARTSIRNIQDMQNDQILGKETLPILLGRRATKVVLAAFLVAAFCVAALTTLHLGLSNPIAKLAILGFSAAYPLAYLWFFHERFTTGHRSLKPPLEAAFYFVGLLALVDRIQASHLADVFHSLWFLAVLSLSLLVVAWKGRPYRLARVGLLLVNIAPTFVLIGGIWGLHAGVKARAELKVGQGTDAFQHVQGPQFGKPFVLPGFQVRLERFDLRRREAGVRLVASAGQASQKAAQGGSRTLPVVEGQQEILLAGLEFEVERLIPEAVEFGRLPVPPEEARDPEVLMVLLGVGRPEPLLGILHAFGAGAFRQDEPMGRFAVLFRERLDPGQLGNLRPHPPHTEILTATFAGQTLEIPAKAGEHLEVAGITLKVVAVYPDFQVRKNTAGNPVMSSRSSEPRDPWLDVELAHPGSVPRRVLLSARQPEYTDRLNAPNLPGGLSLRYIREGEEAQRRFVVFTRADRRVVQVESGTLVREGSWALNRPFVVEPGLSVTPVGLFDGFYPVPAGLLATPGMAAVRVKVTDPITAISERAWLRANGHPQPFHGGRVTLECLQAPPEPKDIHSTLVVTDPQGRELTRKVVGLKDPLVHGGLSFLQSPHSPQDPEASAILVADQRGKWIVWLGYGMLLLGIAWMVSSRWRSV